MKTSVHGTIERIIHDCFKIEVGGLVIYTDPWSVTKDDIADLVLVTHDHFDHCSLEDIAKVSGEGTEIIAAAHCEAKLPGAHLLAAWESTMVKGVLVEAVPAYNIGKPHHPPEYGGVGFIFEVEGRRYYLAGDTDTIPEMASFKVDVAFLPVSGKFTMTAEEAVEAAVSMGSPLVIPMHYGSVIGTIEDATRFQERYPGETIIID